MCNASFLRRLDTFLRHLADVRKMGCDNWGGTMASNSFVSSASISELVYAFPLVVSAVHSVKCALYRLFTLCIVLLKRERERERKKEGEGESP